jgi:hypothetical protein
MPQIQLTDQQYKHRKMRALGSLLSGSFSIVVALSSLGFAWLEYSARVSKTQGAGPIEGVQSFLTWVQSLPIEWHIAIVGILAQLILIPYALILSRLIKRWLG